MPDAAKCRGTFSLCDSNGSGRPPMRPRRTHRAVGFAETWGHRRRHPFVAASHLRPDGRRAEASPCCADCVWTCVLPNC